jgi:hypothetical protein
VHDPPSHIADSVAGMWGHALQGHNREGRQDRGQGKGHRQVQAQELRQTGVWQNREQGTGKEMGKGRQKQEVGRAWV